MVLDVALTDVALHSFQGEFAPSMGRAYTDQIIDPGMDRQVRMANLACVGSFSINGVAALHTELLKGGLLADVHGMFPTRINNKTNGITPRRWLNQANRGLADLVSACCAPDPAARPDVRTVHATLLEIVDELDGQRAS